MEHPPKWLVAPPGLATFREDLARLTGAVGGGTETFRHLGKSETMETS